MSTPTAELLADHFVHLQFADIAAKLIDDSTTRTLDDLGVAFAGSQTDRNGVTSAAIDCALAVRAALKEPLSSVMNGFRYV
jgi:hypothetical protein